MFDLETSFKVDDSYESSSTVSTSWTGDVMITGVDRTGVYFFSITDEIITKVTQKYFAESPLFRSRTNSKFQSSMVLRCSSKTGLHQNFMRNIPIYKYRKGNDAQKRRKTSIFIGLRIEMFSCRSIWLPRLHGFICTVSYFLDSKYTVRSTEMSLLPSNILLSY